jgi:hypothetical protein
MITLTREEAQSLLDALYSMNGTEFLCQAAHHPKKDMHKSGEGCPVAARYMEARETLRARLSAPEPEPYGYFKYDLRLDAWVQNRVSNNGVAFYTTPPQREWQGLTDEEMSAAMDYWSDPVRSAYGGAHSADGEYVGMIDTWQYIEAKLKEKNNG